MIVVADSSPLMDDRPLPANDLGLDPGETAAILLDEALHAERRVGEA